MAIHQKINYFPWDYLRGLFFVAKARQGANVLAEWRVVREGNIMKNQKAYHVLYVMNAAGVVILTYLMKKRLE